ncbi:MULTISPECIES: lipopolysaccharide assembly protein LapB [unclassified Oceanispirochaeta]|uniref:tetratricopeptide repeat protein n=1 Tax=unclassified Oceanispirochaeta TaxID=2635722 RepID=UPI000E092A45|nr:MULTISPECIES: tetratricopeptide repeat protein [unclassified Oceanispirochaeta]MBF9014361.1 tetratricopeptide repeat protein [Oceanispirochaeta sp. M2]NPD71247.1 tetratricopeptide repeat protein [Oceanispirochaeta sp. M1]RDG33632.1 tetratricopeptide repeat protein [Oceanispirochaeta sp. M1]
MNIFILILVPVMLLIYLGFRFRSLLLYFKALKVYGAGNTEKAVTMLKKSVEEGLSNKHQLTVGYLLLKEGFIDDAERIFTYLIHNPGAKFNAQHARSYNALIHWKSDRLDEAVEELEALLTENYRTSSFYSNFGFFLIEQGNLERALEINLEAEAYDGESAVIQDNLGLCYIKLNDWDKAEKLYAKLMEKDPSFPDAWYNAALVAEKKNDKEKAVSYLNTALTKKFSYLSTLSREQVEEQLNKLKV